MLDRGKGLQVICLIKDVAILISDENVPTIGPERTLSDRRASVRQIAHREIVISIIFSPFAGNRRLVVRSPVQR